MSSTLKRVVPTSQMMDGVGVMASADEVVEEGDAGVVVDEVALGVVLLDVLAAAVLDDVVAIGVVELLLEVDSRPVVLEDVGAGGQPAGGSGQIQVARGPPR
jgi:stage III sporulation protein SpoIIIAA